MGSIHELIESYGQGWFKFETVRSVLREGYVDIGVNRHQLFRFEGFQFPRRFFVEALVSFQKDHRKSTEILRQKAAKNILEIIRNSPEGGDVQYYESIPEEFHQEVDRQLSVHKNVETQQTIKVLRNELVVDNVTVQLQTTKNCDSQNKVSLPSTQKSINLVCLFCQAFYSDVNIYCKHVREKHLPKQHLCNINDAWCPIDHCDRHEECYINGEVLCDIGCPQKYDSEMYEKWLTLFIQQHTDLSVTMYTIYIKKRSILVSFVTK